MTISFSNGITPLATESLVPSNEILIMAISCYTKPLKRPRFRGKRVRMTWTREKVNNRWLWHGIGQVKP